MHAALVTLASILLLNLRARFYSTLIGSALV